jgi:hypothetical protein
MGASTRAPGRTAPRWMVDTFQPCRLSGMSDQFVAYTGPSQQLCNFDRELPRSPRRQMFRRPPRRQLFRRPRQSLHQTGPEGVTQKAIAREQAQAP